MLVHLKLQCHAGTQQHTARLCKKVDNAAEQAAVLLLLLLLLAHLTRSRSCSARGSFCTSLQKNSALATRPYH
jgi:hypothetical protein